MNQQFNLYRRIVYLSLFLLGALVLIVLASQESGAELVIGSDDDAPGWVNETSDHVCMMSIYAHNNSQGDGNALNYVNITFGNVSGFDPATDLAGLANDDGSGVSVYHEDQSSGGFQYGEDLRVGTVGQWYGNGTVWNLNITFGPAVSIPNDPAGANFYIVIRTSQNMRNGTRFNVSLNVSYMNSTFGNAPANRINTSVTEGDAVAPTVPSNFLFSNDGDSGGDGIVPEPGFNDDWTIDLAWDGSTDEGGSGLSHYRIGVSWGQSGGSYSEDEDYNVIADGNYTLYICAVDAVGHNSSEVEMGNYAVCNTTLPNGTINVTEQTDGAFIHFDVASDTLYYANHDGAEFNISASFYAWEEHEWKVIFGDGFDVGDDFPDSSAPYDSDPADFYTIQEADSDTQIEIRFIDKAGNVGYRNLTCVKDTWGPTITNPAASEDSDYLNVNGTNIYYGDDMGGAETFSISGSANDSQAGLWKATFPSNALGSPGDDGSPASWGAAYDSVENGDNVVGALTVTLYDMVNNTGTFSYTLFRDTEAPSIDDGDWEEGSSYLYVVLGDDNDDNTIYYGNGMGGNPAPGTLNLTFSDNYNLTNVSYSAAVGIDQEVDVLSGASAMATAVYSFDDGDSYSAAITVRVTDRCGNYAEDTTTFKIERDVTGPSADSQSANENSDYIHVSGTTVYYGDRMGQAQAFNVTGTASDGGAGLLNASFSANVLGNPVDDISPATWLAMYGDVDDSDVWSGTITVTFYDLVNNTNTCTYTVTRDVEVTGVAIVEVYENNGTMHYNAVSETLYYSNDQIMDDIIKIRVQDSEAQSGRNRAVGESAFGDSPSDNSYGSYWELQYTINKDEVSDGIITINIYDNCGNNGTYNLAITVDNDGPNVNSFNIEEDSENLYYNNGNVILYFSNNQAGNNEIEMQIQDDESGSGRNNAIGETAFGETPEDNSYSLWWSITYTISQGETCDGNITITVYDNCGNTGNYTLRVILDNDAPTVSIDDVVESADNVYYNGSALFYSNDQVMSDNFDIRVNDTEYGQDASGRRNASGEWAFGESPDDSDYGGYWSLVYTISQDENCDGTIVITVWDNCGNSNTTQLTLVLDNTVPSLSNFLYSESPDNESWNERYFDPAGLLNGEMHFTWSNSDASSGLASGEMDWDSSDDGDDQLSINAGIGGSYTASGLGDDGTGNISVTIRIYDNTGNFNSSTLTFNFDADDPGNLAITSINEIDNGNNIYMDTGNRKLYYNSTVRIQFHLVITYDDVGVGRNKTMGPNLFGDTPENSSYSGGHYLYYTIEQGENEASNGYTVTVYDRVGRSGTITFDVIRDTTAPTVSSTTISEALHAANLYLNSTSGVFYYNNGVNEPQFEIRIQCTDAEAGRDRASGQTLFGDTPTDSVYDNSRYEILYSVENAHQYNGTVNVTVYDGVNNYAIVTIVVRRDVYAPPTPTDIKADPDGLETYEHYDDDDGVYLYWDFVTDDMDGSDIYRYYAEVNDSSPDVVVEIGHKYHSASAEEGNNSFYVWVSDNVGNYCPVGHDWIVVDTGPPTITGVTVGSDAAWYYTSGIDPDAGGTVWFNSIGGEGGGQVLTLTFSWTDGFKEHVNVTSVFGADADIDSDGAGGWVLQITVPPGAGNKLGIRFWVVDKADNVDTVTIDFKADNDDPVAPTGTTCRPGGPGGSGEYSAQREVWLTWTDNMGDGGSGWKENRMGTNQQPLQNPVNTSGDFAVWGGADGLATFYVFAVDNVGNWARVQDTIIIDTTDPVITDIDVSSDGRYCHDESLGAGGGVVWFNSLAAMGSGQTITLAFQWNEVNKFNITSEAAFGGTPYSNADPWEVEYTVPQDYGDDDVVLTLIDLAGRTVGVTVQFRVDNQNPAILDLDVRDNASRYLYYHEDSRTLYYSDGMGGTDQMLNITALGVADARSGISNVTFDAGFNPLQGIITSAPFIHTYRVNDTDDIDQFNLWITVYDKVGNSFGLNLTVIRDVEAPVLDRLMLFEASRYLHYNNLTQTLYYSDHMPGAEEFHVNLTDPRDNQSGLYCLHSPLEFGALADIFTVLPFNVSYSVTSFDTFEGILAFDLRDMVNNSRLYKLNITRDLTPPGGSYAINESSTYIHYDGNATLYYGIGMAGGERFDLSVLDHTDEESGVGGVLFPATFGSTVMDDQTPPFVQSFSISDGASGPETITISLYDRTYNMFYLTVILVRDVTGPTGVINITELTPYLYYDENSTLYYGKNMPAGVLFGMGVNPITDSESGIYKVIFPALFNKPMEERFEAPYEAGFVVYYSDSYCGWANVTLIDNVGNRFSLPLYLERDAKAPQLDYFEVLEVSPYIYHDGGSKLYYSNNFLDFQEFTVRLSNISDTLSGLLEVRFPAMFYMDELFSQTLNRRYIINFTDDADGAAYKFILYDRVGNALPINLTVILDTDAPESPELTVVENSEYIYYKPGDGRIWFWYSNSMASEEHFTLNITNIDDTGSGVHLFSMPDLFSESGERLDIAGGNYSKKYLIAPGSIEEGSRGISITDNVNNTRTLVLKISLDSNISVEAERTVITENSYYIHYDELNRTLYYGSLPVEENFSVSIPLLAINETGSGVRKIGFSDKLPLETDDHRCLYFIGPEEKAEGWMVFTVHDMVGNRDSFSIRLVRDVEAPGIILNLDGRSEEKFRSTGDRKLTIKTTISEGQSGIYAFYVSNDGKTWKSMLDDREEFRWSIDDKNAGGNRSQGDRWLYFKIIDNVGNERIVPLPYRYSPDDGLGFSDWGPFGFGLGGLFWPWGLLVLVLILGILAFISRRRKDGRAERAENEGGAGGESVTEIGTDPGSDTEENGGYIGEEEMDYEPDVMMESEEGGKGPFDEYEAAYDESEEPYDEGLSDHSRTETDTYEEGWRDKRDGTFYDEDGFAEGGDEYGGSPVPFTSVAEVAPGIDYIPPERESQETDGMSSDGGSPEQEGELIPEGEKDAASYGEEDGIIIMDEEEDIRAEIGGVHDDREIRAHWEDVDEIDAEDDGGLFFEVFENGKNVENGRSIRSEEKGRTHSGENGELGIDKTVDDILGILGSREEKELKKRPLVSPSLLRLNNPALCMHCKKIIKANEPGLRCPNCEKLLHVDCGKEKKGCPECGARFDEFA